MPGAEGSASRPGPAAAAKGLWAAGEAYEPYVGRWSRLVAVEFLAWLGVPAGACWLDVGCGTGALTEAILDRHVPAAVTGVDPSDGFLAYARQRVGDARAVFQAGSAEALPVADRAFDAVVSGLVLNFVPDAAKAVSEMRRAARRGGTVAAYVWDYAEGMQMMRRFWDAAAALDPEGARGRDEALRFPQLRRLLDAVPGGRGTVKLSTMGQVVRQADREKATTFKLPQQPRSPRPISRRHAPSRHGTGQR